MGRGVKSNYESGGRCAKRNLGKDANGRLKRERKQIIILDLLKSE
jgi:hypothetical protein